MSRKPAASAIELIPSRIAAKSSHELGTFTHPLPFFRSNLHTLDHKDRRDSSKPKVDFSSVKDVDDAIFLFREIERMRPQPSVLVYNNLLSVLVKMKHHSVALGVFDKMRAPVNEFTFSIAINCYCLVGRVDFGLSILGIIFKSDYEPDVTTFTTLLKGQFLDHKVAEAEKMFKKLLVLKLCEPNDVMILTCKKGKIEEAWSLFLEVPRKSLKHDTITYNTMIHGLFKKGRFADGWKLFKDMEAQQVHPSLNTYSILLDGLCKNKEIPKAVSFLHTMEEEDIIPNIVKYDTLINGLCKDGKRSL